MIVLGSAILAPSQLSDLLRLARDARAGFSALRRAVDALGPQFGFRGPSAG